jgi:vacuolar protein sorting-associated protein 13D
VGEERLKISARSETSVPYALDEPTQPAHVTIAAPGGTSLIVNMDDLRYSSHLTYENFFYIAFTATFPSAETLCGIPIRSGMGNLELVLDVPEGNSNKVVLRKKQNGNRSQLWRVNADGLIEHEGSR